MPMFMPVVFELGKVQMASEAFTPKRNLYVAGAEPLSQLGSSYDFYDYQEKEKGALCFYRVGYENFLMLEKAKRDLSSKKGALSAKDKVIAVSHPNFK
jgi:hypothetical protein